MYHSLLFDLDGTLTDSQEGITKSVDHALRTVAGIETAERMSAAGVTMVLSGYVGPKAFEALKAARIKVCQDLDGMTVREAVEKYKNGDAPFADAPNK